MYCEIHAHIIIFLIQIANLQMTYSQKIIKYIKSVHPGYAELL